MANKNMKTILSIDDQWILEELIVPHQEDGRINVPPPRSDACRCYWLIRSASTTDISSEDKLSVHEDDFPVGYCSSSSSAAGIIQIFRLSCLFLQVPQFLTSPPPSTNPNTQIQASTNIGTKILHDNKNDSSIKIWEFRLAPQASCDYHQHLRPYFFLNLTESLTQELDREGDPVAGRLPQRQTKGQCTYVTDDHLSSHAVLNVGTETFLQFVVEFMD